VSGFESIDDDGELDPLGDPLADSIASPFDTLKTASALFGPQLDAVKMAGLQLDTLKTATALFGSQLDAVKMAGPQLDTLKTATALFGSQFDTLKTASALFSPQLDTLKTASALFGPQLDLAELATALISPHLDPLIGLTELQRLLTNPPVLPGVDHSVAALDREQIRQLWGQYVYVQVLILCALLLLFFTIKLGTAENSLLTVITGTTGVSGMTVASRARKIAVNNFDNIFPPGQDVTKIINIII
jgi:hypothetical protein